MHFALHLYDWENGLGMRPPDHCAVADGYSGRDWDLEHTAEGRLQTRIQYSYKYKGM
jgi:hypothetical protein